MLPRAPEQIRPDVYPQGEGSGFEDEEKRQFDYEAEVKVYRALEKLEDNIIVLHGFEYTHHQYRLCNTTHVRKGCSDCKGKNAGNREGECDFLVICQGGFVVMEVKNMVNVEREVLECEEGFHLCTIGEDSQKPTCASVSRQLEALKGTFLKSVSQRRKIAELIRCMGRNEKVLQFTAYPNFSKTFRGDFNLSSDQEATIVFKEDLKNFRYWWHINVESCLSQTTPSTEWEKLKKFLIAVWCTDKDSCDKLQCSLGRRILDIDRKLREALITFQGKKGKRSINNPGVVEAPVDIKNLVGVKYLTTEQNRVLNSKEQLLWINGPAGTGKTILICAKILQLVQLNKDENVVVFKVDWPGNCSNIYKTVLKRAHVGFREMNYFPHSPHQLSEVLHQVNCTQEEQVIIVNLRLLTNLGNLITMLSLIIMNFHVFFDDIHKEVLNGTAEHYNAFVDKILELSSNRTVWLACDMVQISFLLKHADPINFTDVVSNKIPPKNMANLSMNLRNTCDLSKILSVIRGRYIELFGDSVAGMFPKQSPGHYIHGPRTKVHLLDKYDILTISTIIKTELDELSDCDGMLTGSNLAIIHDVMNKKDELYLRLTEMALEQSSDASDTISCFRWPFSYSAEWPAIIALSKQSEGHFSIGIRLASLYLQISRARVYCSVIFYPGKEEKSEKSSGTKFNLLDELKDHVHVLQYRYK